MMKPTMHVERLEEVPQHTEVNEDVVGTILVEVVMVDKATQVKGHLVVRTSVEWWSIARMWPIHAILL